ncbi:hypothetical protein G3A43_07835 [Paraburkholderia aspalathi]|nr:hypothetical protein [Paraburkholderia aspalathi]MBK3780166.1 hypothetical protein [Paraburkholderia aspalathi]
MSKRKTEEEVQAEISALRELLPLMPHLRRNIGVALRVLTERLTNDDVYDAFEQGSELFEDANTTRMWRDGDSSSDALSTQWRETL